MRVLLAFDKFKDAMTAPEACDIAASELKKQFPDWEVDLCPLADGGEGFATILTAAAGGTLTSVEVTGPRGERRSARYGLVSAERVPAAALRRMGMAGSAASIAIIEMAEASGLMSVPLGERDPWVASSVGTGELLRAAAGRFGPTNRRDGAPLSEVPLHLLLGVGGSATHDLGAGALSALGWRFFGAGPDPISTPVPATWGAIERIEGTLPAGFPPVWIACDVANPLLGPSGAAAVYAPQKGLRPADFGALEAASARMASMICRHAEKPIALMEAAGAGAAGGIAFGLMAGAGGRLIAGSDLISDWLDLDRRIAAADLVITGEGRFDDSSLSGKGPGAVAARARALGKSVHIFAGQISLSTEDAASGAEQPPPSAVRRAEQPSSRAGFRLHAITPQGVPIAEALRTARKRLAEAVGAASFGDT